jgi:hypothetical protein
VKLAGAQPSLAKELHERSSTRVYLVIGGVFCLIVKCLLLVPGLLWHQDKMVHSLHCYTSLCKVTHTVRKITALFYIYNICNLRKFPYGLRKVFLLPVMVKVELCSVPNGYRGDPQLLDHMLQQSTRSSTTHKSRRHAVIKSGLHFVSKVSYGLIDVLGCLRPALLVTLLVCVGSCCPCTCVFFLVVLPALRQRNYCS